MLWNLLFIALLIPTFAKNLSVHSFMKNDDCRSEGGERLLQSKPLHRCLQFLGEMFHVSFRRVSQEPEQIIVQPVGSRPINHNVGYGQNFEQQPGALILIGADTQKALCVDDDGFVDRIVGCPHSNGARFLGRRCFEDLLSAEEGVI